MKESALMIKEINITPILYILIPIILGVIMNTLLIKLKLHKVYIIIIFSVIISIIYIQACSLYFGSDSKLILKVILLLIVFFILLSISLIVYIIKLILYKNR